jgi:hypothetical protein
MSEDFDRSVDIPGWGGYYRVTSDGKFFSYHSYNNPKKEWKEYFPWIGDSGYRVADFVKTINGCTIKKRVKVHRLLYSMFVAPIPEPMQVDHVNRDRLDNRLENLRLATSAQNQWNRSGKSTGFKGISFYKRVGKWMCRITCDGKHYFLGYFDTEMQASIAYDLKAIELYGTFAHTNFIKTADALLREQTNAPISRC